MTITIAYLRRRKQTVELVMASDSRLRMCGPMDQAQKLFRLMRGDCCLAFCGDAQIAYLFSIQVGTALDNHVKTRTRARDVTRLSSTIEQWLNALVSAWDLPEVEKEEQLATTRILFGGWSWENRRFDVGCFAYAAGTFSFHHPKSKSQHPWYERQKSLLFLGDYQDAYAASLRSVLERRFGRPRQKNERVTFDFDYEPVEALNDLLRQNLPEHTAIGGAPQIVKIYPFCNSIPFATRTEEGFHLLGRKLFEWEKTEYPIVDFTKEPAKVLYPLEQIPLPSALSEQADQNASTVDDPISVETIGAEPLTAELWQH